MMKNTYGLLALLATLFLSGCASGYKQFYRPAQGATAEAIARLRVAPPPDSPIVERAQPTEAQVVIDAYAKRGYVMIGNSMFNSGRPESEGSAISQAKEVGADLVLILSPKYTGSITSSIPITTPTTSTSYSTATATAYGARGSATAYGTGTTTTYGTTTNYVPMTIHRSDYGAVFFIKQKFRLGAFFRDLSDLERQELQTNKGVVVRLIADGTPAFNADLLVGDKLLSIDGLPIQNSEWLMSYLQDRRGSSVALKLLRHGQYLEKTIALNP
ncbi:PDZ domain-containing protein [Paucibacter sp. KBW04]|uniref:PDZ domain-containing protein n=1 Tax=Paucibacter sp. KBW04 TaxID=2153361 RepID=UPI000F583CB7|nr:PDZ domain-containing protein [Paucibacter sp. KBW04]RQO58436.1 PDZ domain-containing protein [Paucibacter sp. KBW04]